MRADIIVQSQLMVAQAIQALAEHVSQSSGYNFTPLKFANAPASFSVGSIACFSDSTVNTWGGVVAGGGSFTVLAFYNGTNWKVFAA